MLTVNGLADKLPKLKIISSTRKFLYLLPSALKSDVWDAMPT